MDPYTVSERKEQDYWRRFWENYEQYPVGTRFRIKPKGSTLVKMEKDNRHGITRDNLFSVESGLIYDAKTILAYPFKASDYEILTSTGEPYQH